MNGGASPDFQSSRAHRRIEMTTLRETEKTADDDSASTGSVWLRNGGAPASGDGMYFGPLAYHLPRVEIQLAMPRRHDTGEGPSILFARRCIWSRSRKWRRATADSREALELDMVFAPFTHGQIVQVLCHCGF